MARPRGPRHGGSNNVRGGRNQASRTQERSEADVTLSKKMSRTLRHHPPACMDGSGWVPLAELVSHIGAAQSVEQVLRVVSTDAKGRFEHLDATEASVKQAGVLKPVVPKRLATMQKLSQVLKSTSEGLPKQINMQVDMGHTPPRIRATQGHSIALETPVLQPVTQASEVPVAVHLTRRSTWDAIQQDGYLRRMARTHIHFATKPVLARTNKWADSCLQLNVQQALDDRIPLFLSSNGVLLVEGPLPVKYVTEVAEFPTA